MHEAANMALVLRALHADTVIRGVGVRTGLRTGQLSSAAAALRAAAASGSGWRPSTSGTPGFMMPALAPAISARPPPSAA